MERSLEMVETKLMISSLLLAFAVACAPAEMQMSWQKHVVDGHMTGVTAPSADNVADALGVISGSEYTAPNGAVFTSGCTASVARAIIEVQPRMVRLKEVLGQSLVDMSKHRPESALSNMVADVLRDEVAELTGREVDVAIANFGGIRTDFPSGDILLDDIVSMLPFINKLSYVALRGKDLRNIFEYLARTAPQPVSGARLVIENRKLIKAEVGGKPLNDNKIYGVATLDFLLDGGDGLKIAKNARELVITEELPSQMMEKYIRKQTELGKKIEYFEDGRVIWKR